MAKFTDKPIIMPLSNPLSHSEAIPEDLLLWTNNQAVVSTGSPFPYIIKNEQAIRVDQTNNVYIFPGIGLGLIAVQASKVTDRMFLLAAQALAACSPAVKDEHANLLPELTEIRNVSFHVALAVAKEAVHSGLAPVWREEEIIQKIQSLIWEPEYIPYEFASKE